MTDTATRIVRTLQKAGHTAYFAGGGVRDRLLGREPKDIDIATSATPNQVQKLFPRHSGLVGKVFGVINVIEDDMGFEIAQFRKDGPYLDGRRPSRVDPATPEEDAHRRDFTINGLFFDPVADRVIDFVGGRKDLEARRLRAIGTPEDRFGEDKLRLLRAVRFATTLRVGREYFDLEPATWEALCRLAPRIHVGSPEDNTPAGEREWFIAPERVRDELDKMWVGPWPERGLDLLDKSGLLARVLPEIAELHGIEQPPQFHPEGDVYEHVKLMMSKLHEPDLILALSVLFHDVGKKPTQTVDETGRIRFNGHETVGADMTEVIMRRMRYSNDTIAAVCELVRYHMQFKDVQRMKISTIKKMMSRGHFKLELELHRIDCLSSHGDIENYDLLVERGAEFSQETIDPPALINGHDVLALGIPPGKRVRDVLDAIREDQLNGEIETREQALGLAKRLAGALMLADIPIRDPFILPRKEAGEYLLFGTTDANAGSTDPATGFDFYRSPDLRQWKGPHPAFRPPERFWATTQFWSPEVHALNGRHYMLATFKSPDHCRGTQVLAADAPEGPYTPWSDGPVTPPDWECLDGTLHIEADGTPHLVFCHEWLQIGDGTICAMPLTADLKAAAGEPMVLFRGSDARWARPVPARKYPDAPATERGLYVTDGPFLYRTAAGALLMLWSSNGPKGYALGIARSESGTLAGPWRHEEDPLWKENGGHGMIFTHFDGRQFLALHQPNETPLERARLFEIVDEGETIRLKL